MYKYFISIAFPLLMWVSGFAQNEKINLLNTENVSKEIKKSNWKWTNSGNFYFSWGYNIEWYSPSTIHVEQAPGNSYDLVSVHGTDKPGWENLFHVALTIPQYNYRLGYFFSEDQNWGIEINFDHTKYQIEQQNVHVKGMRNGRGMDTSVVFNDANGFHWELNNGANFLLFNLMRRINLFGGKDANNRVDAIFKAGIGPVIPHVENTLFGNPNKQQFQFGGWNIGLETGFRAVFLKYIFIDFSQKLDYASYSHLLVYNDGRASQDFLCYELILTAGINIPHLKKGKNIQK